MFRATLRSIEVGSSPSCDWLKHASRLASADGRGPPGAKFKVGELSGGWSSMAIRPYQQAETAGLTAKPAAATGAQLSGGLSPQSGVTTSLHWACNH